MKGLQGILAGLWYQCIMSTKKRHWWSAKPINTGLMRFGPPLLWKESKKTHFLMDELYVHLMASYCNLM